MPNNFFRKINIFTSSASGGAAATNFWKLDGNTEGSQKYFGTDDNYSIPIYTNGVSRGIIGNNGDFAFGSGSLLSNTKVYIQSSNDLPSYYAFNIDNSDIMNSTFRIVSIKNDGQSIFTGYDNATTGKSTVKIVGSDSTLNNNALVVANSSSNIAVFRNDGNIGIGTSSPTDKLTLKVLTTEGISLLSPTNNRSIRMFHYTGLGGNLYINSDAGDDLKIALGSSSTSWINNGYYFGIGTSSPTNTLNVNTPNNGEGISISRSNVTKLKLFTYSGIGGAMYMYDDSNNLTVSLTGEGEQCYILNQKFGIGTSTPTSKLQVVGLATYANNAAAITAGLTAGAFYIRTGHGLDVVV